jgi:hypothetical protein
LLKDCNLKIIHIRNNPTADITSDSVVWVNDVFSKDELDNMLHGQQPAYVVNDHFVTTELLNYQVYCAPFYLANSANFIVKNLPEKQEYQTQYTFNFMINKKQINRFLCMKLVELFGLTNYNYTWSGVDSRFDMTDILNELNYLGSSSPLTPEQVSFLLSNITIPARFINQIDENNNNSYLKFSNTSDSWNGGLNNIFASSAVSLITESLSFQKSIVFTEKTAYALLGKTFPIWIGGGINQAQKFEQMGFDVFHDVIDHSYQFYDTLIERCYYAFERNLDILTNYEYSCKIRESMMHRLDLNQQLLKNKQVDIFCKQQISQWPRELQQAISEELINWLKG